jgi:hypothetical protein
MEGLAGYESFAADLREELLSKALDESNLHFREEVFTEYVVGFLYESGLANDAEICHAEIKGAGSKPGGKISAWALSSDGTTLDLFVSLYHGTPVDEIPALGKTELQKQLNLGIGFLKRCLEGIVQCLEESSPGFLAAKAIHDSRETLITLNLYFLTDGLARSQDIDELSKVGDIEIRRHVWDIEKLSRAMGRDGHDPIRIDFVNDFAEHGGAVACLARNDKLGAYQTYLAFFPATLLAEIYGRHGQRLLERNVRAFLQAKGKVNKGLQRTLREEPNWFLAYNNGLCCTATRVGVRDAKSGHAVLDWAEDFQIINGGQTTASIYHALRNSKSDVDLDQVTVQVKLTVLSDPDQAAEVVPLISQYANSQNKVSAADLFANGKYHVELEKLSRSVWAPATSGLGRGTRWYYERARGSYSVEKARQGTPAKQKAWAEQHPLSQKFSKTDLAKFLHAWDGLPHFVCRGAEKNFTEFARRLVEESEPVVNVTYFQRVVAKAILWRGAEAQFDELGLKSFRAIAVAYSVAWLAEKSERRIDLDEIWKRQALPKSTVSALAAVLPIARKFVAEVAGWYGVNPEGPPKTQKYWEEFRKVDVMLPDGWKRDLADEPMVDAVSGIDAVEQEWARLCRRYGNDMTQLSELYIGRGKHAPKKIGGKTMSVLSAYPAWSSLREQPFELTIAKFKQLVEVVSAAAQQGELNESTEVGLHG